MGNYFPSKSFRNLAQALKLNTLLKNKSVTSKYQVPTTIMKRYSSTDKRSTLPKLNKKQLQRIQEIGNENRFGYLKIY